MKPHINVKITNAGSRPRGICLDGVSHPLPWNRMGSRHHLRHRSKSFAFRPPRGPEWSTRQMESKSQTPPLIDSYLPFDWRLIILPYGVIGNLGYSTLCVRYLYPPTGHPARCTPSILWRYPDGFCGVCCVWASRHDCCIVCTGPGVETDRRLKTLWLCCGGFVDRDVQVGRSW